MKQTDITRIRLWNQQIESTNLHTVKDLVGWMGAMQAQDYAMAKWAIGIRLPGITDAAVEQAIHNGDILRTHVLRPTWHFVRPEDIRWMLEISAPQIKTSMQSRDRELGLDDALYKKTNRALEKMLAGQKHLTREEILTGLKKVKLVSDTSQAWHVIVRAEIAGILCSGMPDNKNQTYALLDERIPAQHKVDRDEALCRLAQLYFNSHGPATTKDFAWWSGLSAAAVRTATETLPSSFIAATIGTETYWLPDSTTLPVAPKNSVYLLPAFDEYLISYKDRTAAIKLTDQARAFTSNGIFRPVIVVNGEVTGTWRRTFKKDKALIQPDFLKPPTKAVAQQLHKAAESYGRFYDKTGVLTSDD